VLGYGNLGRTAALNLRDSGLKLVIGNREDEYAAQARAEGFEVLPLAAASAADVVVVLLPDEGIPDAFLHDPPPPLPPPPAPPVRAGRGVRRPAPAGPWLSAPATAWLSGSGRAPPAWTCSWWRPGWPVSPPASAISRAKASGPASASRRTPAAARGGGCSAWP